MDVHIAYDHDQEGYASGFADWKRRRERRAVGACDGSGARGDIIRFGRRRCPRGVRISAFL